MFFHIKTGDIEYTQRIINKVKIPKPNKTQIIYFCGGF